MTGFFYTLDIGEEHGMILQRIASFWGYEDVEDYAADLLCGALREAETMLNSELYKLYETEIEVLNAVYKARNAKAERERREMQEDAANAEAGADDLDDGIPF